MCIALETLRFNNPRVYREIEHDEKQPEIFTELEARKAGVNERGHNSDLIFENKKFRVWREINYKHTKVGGRLLSIYGFNKKGG